MKLKSKIGLKNASELSTRAIHTIIRNTAGVPERTGFYRIEDEMRENTLKFFSRLTWFEVCQFDPHGRYRNYGTKAKSEILKFWEKHNVKAIRSICPKCGHVEFYN